MELIQSLFNYAWQAVVYAFLAWLVYYFFKNANRFTQISVCLVSILVAALGFSSGVIEESFNSIDAASEQHIKHIKSVQKTYDV